MDHLIVSIIISFLIVYFNYNSHHGAKEKRNRNLHQTIDASEEIVWQQRGHVTPTDFALFHLRFLYRGRHLEPPESIRVCVEPVEDGADVPPHGDPDLYLTYDHPNGVGYEPGQHDGSATSYGVDCVTLDFSTRGGDLSALVGIYGYTPFPHPSPPIAFRLLVVTTAPHDLVEVEVVPTLTPPPLDLKGTDFEEQEDNEGSTTSGIFTNTLTPPTTRRFVRREAGRKQKSEPAIWTVLIGFLNILAEIL